MASLQQSLRLENAITELLQHERFREMIKYLYECKDELIAAQKVEIVFNCAGPKVKPRRTIYD